MSLSYPWLYPWLHPCLAYIVLVAFGKPRCGLEGTCTFEERLTKTAISFRSGEGSRYLFAFYANMPTQFLSVHPFNVVRENDDECNQVRRTRPNEYQCIGRAHLQVKLCWASSTQYLKSELVLAAD